MTSRFTLRMAAAVAMAFSLSSVASADLLLDVQPAGGITAAGYQALEATNQVLPGAGTTYTAASTGFSSAVTVTFGVANLPDGNLDFRAVTRNGAANDVNNDWVGVDTRVGGLRVTMSLTFAGLPAGTYTWLSRHVDGGIGVNGAGQGNINGEFDYSLVSASGTQTGKVNQYAGVTGPPGPTDGILSLNFTSNGSNVVFSQIMDSGQGGTNNAIFAFTSAVEIRTAAAIPEPTSLLVVGLGMVGFVVRRRK